MVKRIRLACLWLVVTTLLLACAPATPSGPAAGSSPGSASSGSQAAPTTAPAAQPNRTLVAMTRVEPKSILSKGILTGVFADGPVARRLFNAALYIEDEREVPHPYLVEQGPQLNTDTWKINADGTMETTYRLKPSLTWHDGQPLTAEDFVFGLRVLADPALAGMFTPTPQNLMDEVLAPDARTVVIKWKRTSGDADYLVLNRFQPLPRHILEPAYQQGNPESFGSLPFWTREFVGAGPFKIDRWDAGAAIEGSAFDGHALGRPKIDRVRVLFVPDANVVVANLLSGTAHVTMDDVIRFQQAQTLKQEWAASQGGEVVLAPSQTHYIQVQFRPEYVSPRAMLDHRVRQALIQSIDRKELSDAMLGGEGIVASMMVGPLRENYTEIDRAVTKYPLDLNRTQQLMSDAGFTKGSDGTYASASGERFSPELRAISGGTDEQELSALTDFLRRAGFNIQPLAVSPAQANDGQYVATFPAMNTANTATGSDTPLVKLWTGRVPGPENRWAGSALGGWANAAYDKGYDAYNTTLDRAGRNNVVLNMMKLVADELPVLPLYYIFQVDAHVSSLLGPTQAGTTSTWNVHEWQFK